MTEPWQKVLIAAGGAAAVGSLLYCLCSDGPETEEAGLAPAGRDTAIEILQEMVAAQSRVKDSMKVLSRELAEEPALTFEQIYAKVRAAEPADPLEARGMTPRDLESLLQSCHADPLVQRAMHELTAPLVGETAGEGSGGKARTMTLEEIVEVHAFMLEELQKFAENFRGRSDRGSFSTKTVVVAAQAVLDSKTSAKFGVTSEDLGAAVMGKQDELKTSERFMSIHMQMQQAMVSLGDGL